MQTRTVRVEQIVEVSIDDTKFTPEFMAEFNRTMYRFGSVNKHIEHLAQLYARGIADEYSFIEGYGKASEFGIKFRHIDGDQEIITPESE